VQAKPKKKRKYKDREGYTPLLGIFVTDWSLGLVSGDVGFLKIAIPKGD
jgi:hypothetical protein